MGLGPGPVVPLAQFSLETGDTSDCYHAALAPWRGLGRRRGCVGGWRTRASSRLISGSGTRGRTPLHDDRGGQHATGTCLPVPLVDGPPRAASLHPRPSRLHENPSRREYFAPLVAGPPHRAYVATQHMAVRKRGRAWVTGAISNTTETAARSLGPGLTRMVSGGGNLLTTRSDEVTIQLVTRFGRKYWSPLAASRCDAR